MHPLKVVQPTGLAEIVEARLRGAGSPWRDLLVALSIAVLVGCGGSSSGGSDDDDDVDDDETVDEQELSAVTGNATKGPLVDADVTVFMLDTADDTLRGEEVATGITNEQAVIEVELEEDLEGLLLVEVNANADTTDLTTGQAPVLSRLSTVTEAQDWLEGQPVYATPLSHLAVEIAIRNIGGEDVGRAQTRSALARAQTAVRETMGFGLLVDAEGEPIDLFSTAPVLTNDAVDDETRQRTLRYRKASEAVAAVMAELSGSTEAADIEAMFDTIIDDLSTGRIDDDDLAGDLETTDPEGLPIPNDPDGRTVAETRDIVNEEREQVGADSEDVEDLEADDDEPSQAAQRDSGLTTEDLAGGVTELTLAVAPDGGGEVSTRDGDQVDTSTYEVGVDDTVTVTAAAAEDFAFVRWTDNGEQVSTSEAFRFTVQEDGHDLTAEFSGGLSLMADPSDGGLPSGEGQFEPGEAVTVEANPHEGFSFDAWVERQDGMFVTPSVADDVEDAEAESFTFEMPTEPLVLFALYDFTAATVNEVEYGSIEREGTFSDGEDVTLTAVPNPGFVFLEWRNADDQSFVSDDAELTFEFSEGDEFIAVFEAEPTTAVWDDFEWDDGSTWAGD